MSVVITVSGHTALITIDHPPVNSLSLAVRAGLFAAYTRVLEDPSIDAAILTGAGRAFSAGGDIKELDTPAALAPPGLSADLHPLMERCASPGGKLLAAALNGFTIGGGLETALVCHARIARAGVRLALPETGLGIIPLSGTQRLPRIAGVELSLEMIVFGRALDAAEGHRAGLVDQVVDEGIDLVAATHAWVTSTLASCQIPPLPSRRAVSPRAALALIRSARLRLDGAAGSPAQYGALAAIEATMQESNFEQGIARARGIYDRLLKSRTHGNDRSE
jgi:enoyl-CoA hydratase/carnithine racemase